MTDPLIPAQIDWQDGRPRSKLYGDIYHAVDGVRERMEVFVGLNHLDTRFGRLEERGRFRIGELGFGTGLNFICAVDRFLARSPGTARLDFVSVEKHPLTWNDLRRAARQHPALAHRYEELVSSYPVLIPGWHRLPLFQERVSLSVYFGEAQAGLDALVTAGVESMDCWFLDGFAPDKNPEMWDENVLAALPKLSHDATTLATFSVAGGVRRCLEGLGFALERVSGAPRKRHLLAGRYRGAPSARSPRRRLAVIGAGIAGACAARALANRGHDVTVIAPASDVHGAASANPAAALQPRLLPNHRPTSHLRAKAFDLACAFYRGVQHRSHATFWHPIGLAQLPGPNVGIDRLERIGDAYRDCHWLLRGDAATLSSMIGRHVTGVGLWFPRSGWIDLRAACEALLTHPHIARVHSLVTELRSGTLWSLGTDSGKDLACDQLVIAAGPQVSAFELTSHLPLATVAGQLSIVSWPHHGLRAVLSGDGYVAPLSPDRLAAGATYVRESSAHLPDADGRRANTQRLRSMLGGLGEIDIVEDFAAIRTTSADRQPIMGEITGGVHVSAAHGSHGAAMAPLAAEIIAGSIDREPPVLDPAELRQLNPARFEPRRGFNSR
jgi:tRNA 5-methylaminomethyl-2-thiouridine biosynthesis bifunctional protein